MKAEPEALTGCNRITRVYPAGKVRPKPEVGSLAAARFNSSQTEQQGVTMKNADEKKALNIQYLKVAIRKCLERLALLKNYENKLGGVPGEEKQEILAKIVEQLQKNISLT